MFAQRSCNYRPDKQSELDILNVYFWKLEVISVFVKGNDSTGMTSYNVLFCSNASQLSSTQEERDAYTNISLSFTEHKTNWFS